jgi:hypothetical protein
MQKYLMMTVLAAGVLMGVDNAWAQDQSSYTMQLPKTLSVDPADQAYNRQLAQQRRFNEIEPRGGRDPRGGFYGRPTVWPGDYRDALDRGQFPAGGPHVIPRRSFNGY